MGLKPAVDISILIPAYNAMPELTRTLDSVVGQSYDAKRMEVIVVDDCSNDESWEEVCRFAASYPDLIVAERLTAPSGSPARPRNVALSKARGEFVFFLDADDWFNEHAVSKMLEHAREWRSDVLLVKLAGANGREVPKSMFTHDQQKVDVYRSKVMWSLGPLKLFRRSLLLENDLRFFEEGMPEDLHVVVPAMCLADVVSVASDYDYCFVSLRNAALSQGENASLSIWNDWESNVRSYEALMAFIDENTTDEQRSAALMRRLFRRDVFEMIASMGKGEPSRESYDRVKELFKSYYVEQVYRTCPVEKRLVLDSFFFGSYEDLDRVVGAVSSGVGSACFDSRRGRLFGRLSHVRNVPRSDITEGVQVSCALESFEFASDGEIDFSGCLMVDGVPCSWMKDAKMLLICKDGHGLWRASLPCEISSVGSVASIETMLRWKCKGTLKPILGWISMLGASKLRLCLQINTRGYRRNCYLDKWSIKNVLACGSTQVVGDGVLLDGRSVILGGRVFKVLLSEEGKAMLVAAD
ncbi:glycosyltransferase family 2 protein [Paraeggerthella hongkongensis]|uniref:Glycosyltransferase 2-like domain-containing protein n=1 Tax=Paraeggerthella hongkongensis TaxID=230658 RepID=A0A3N0AZW6_9ACTN|nr:glycosyltransferase family 2 protein [Paraeggerthella hongkongensis]RNL40417.1 hypothetical protein DMP08_10320 [Paraeggerthella hongkongensis]